MIPLLRNELQTFFGWIAVMLAQTKGHNRAVHPGEKSDKDREGSEVGCGWLQTNSAATLLRRFGKTARNSNATLSMR